MAKTSEVGQQLPKRRLISFTHVDSQGSQDYEGVLSVEFSQDGDQWVGVCKELDTVAHADTLDEADKQLQEAVSLQLNEMEKIADVREYLVQNQVDLLLVPAQQATGFHIASNPVTV